MAERPRLLLVDDEDRVLNALRRTLRRLPVEIETARNAREALARLSESPDVGLVVSDFKMPGMNGIELLKRIRKQRPEVARILLSGFSAEIPEADLTAAGLLALLAKPWDDGALKAAIREGLGLD